jgi:hypothetical protein
MKNYMIILIFGLFVGTLSGQEGPSSFKLISNANFDQLTDQLDEKVELILPKRADVFPKAKVIVLLQEAIQRIEQIAWKEKHIGGTRGGESTYSVGHIKTASGKNYRMYIVKEKVRDRLKIVSIELELQ